MKFDNVSFSKEGFENFKTLTKEKQIEKLANLLNPKDEERAKVLLKNVPHGNISSGDDKEASDNNGIGTAEESKRPNRAGQRKEFKKSKD